MTDKAKLKKIKKLADAMYYSAFNLTTDASLLRKAMEEYHQFIIHECKKEPVSEKKCMFTKDSFTNEDRKVLCDGCEEECKYAQKEEPVSEELEEAAEKYAYELCPSIGVANTEAEQSFKAGAKWQKEQLMAKAVEGGCFSYKNGFVHISCDVDEHLTDIKFGDKVKVIVIKED